MAEMQRPCIKNALMKGRCGIKNDELQRPCFKGARTKGQHTKPSVVHKCMFGILNKPDPEPLPNGILKYPPFCGAKNSPPVDAQSAFSCEEFERVNLIENRPDSILESSCRSYFALE